MDTPTNPGGGSALPWDPPADLGGAPTKMKPGEGLKQFLSSGAFEAFQKADKPKTLENHSNLSELLNLYGGPT